MAGERERGIYRKYFVQRLDPATEQPGEVLVLRRRYFDEVAERARDVPALPPPKHSACRYFVLDLEHDAFAGPALRAYADACEAEFPVLAADLRAMAPSASAPPQPAAGACMKCRSIRTADGACRCPLQPAAAQAEGETCPRCKGSGWEDGGRFVCATCLGARRSGKGEGGR